MTLRDACRRVPALLLVPTLALTACSGDDEPEPTGGGDSAATTPEQRLPTTTRIGQVVGGKLAAGQRRALVRKVTAVVDRWIDGAYVAGDYPRTDFDGAFRGFTGGAARLAAAQPRIMSNRQVGPRVDGVTATRRTVWLDVLAPSGRPAGVTARVALVMDLTGDVERTDSVSGRLALTPDGKGGWQVFGFDVRRGEVKGR